MWMIWQMGPWSLRIYSLLIYLGIVLGLAAALYKGRQWGLPAKEVASAGLWALAGGLAVGRLAHVGAHWADYARQPWAALELGRPFAYHGLLSGTLLGMALFAAVRGMPVWPLADALASGAPVVLLFGWAASLFRGVAYGRPSYAAWSWELPDIHGVLLPRIPTQAMGAILAGLLGAALFLARPRRPGILLGAFLLVSSLGHFALEFTRGDPTWYVGPLRISQVAYLVELLGAMIIFVVLIRGGHASSDASGTYPFVERQPTT